MPKINIGALEINGVAALAPMAGVADMAFRELCAGFGASWCVGEMVSAKGLTMGSKDSAELLRISPAERPAAVQLFGCEPDVMAKAAAMALAYNPDAIDINMGCPAPKITGGGAGSALMRNPALCGEIVRAVAEAAGGVPVTVKMRAGWDASSVNAPEVASICEQAGAAAITVHARTRAQIYAPPVDLSVIRAVKQAVSVPVIGNGDIYTANDAMRMLEETGCDMVMVGRGAMGNPWIFREINAMYGDNRPLPPPGIAEKLTGMRKHIERMIELKGEYIAMREARKHTAWYLRGMKGAARLRIKCSGLSSREDLERLIIEIFEINK